MFTGIIEELGTVLSVRNGAKSYSLTIRGAIVSRDLALGDSVAVNGVCLTAAQLSGDTFTADVMHETLSRSSLGGLKQGSRVNLERAMKLGGRFGGHIVSGHIDGTGIVTRLERDDNAVWYTISADAHVMRYIVEKGSVAIDGVSLTVAREYADAFSISVIPHTTKNTILSEKCVGAIVNIENDIIGKYVEKLTVGAVCGTQTAAESGGVTLGLLAESGFL